MADTWTIDYTLVAMTPSKCLMSLWNGVSSAKVLRVYRVFASNSTTVTNFSMLGYIQMHRISAHSGGIAYTPVTRDTANGALDSNVSAATGATVTLNGKLRTWLWSTNASTSSGTNLHTYELCYPIQCLWDIGYHNGRLQPITLRAGEGIAIINNGQNSVGLIDFWVEFTQAAS